MQSAYWAYRSSLRHEERSMPCAAVDKKTNIALDCLHVAYCVSYLLAPA